MIRLFSFKFHSLKLIEPPRHAKLSKTSQKLTRFHDSLDSQCYIEVVFSFCTKQLMQPTVSAILPENVCEIFIENENQIIVRIYIYVNEIKWDTYMHTPDHHSHILCWCSHTLLANITVLVLSLKCIVAVNHVHVCVCMLNIRIYQPKNIEIHVSHGVCMVFFFVSSCRNSFLLASWY